MSETLLSEIMSMLETFDWATQVYGRLENSEWFLEERGLKVGLKKILRYGSLNDARK